MLRRLPGVFHRRLLGVGLAAACWAGTGVDAGAAERAEPVESPAPAFPAALSASSVNTGHALVLCGIDDAGRVFDVWTLEASHPAFAAAAESAVATWRYGPATAAAPDYPWPRRDVVRFDFTRKGQITALTHAEAAAAAFLRAQPAQANWDELPMLKPRDLRRTEGAMPTPPAATPAGEVRLEFLVDREGCVRVPFVLKATHPEQARAALAAVRAWRFAPPAITAQAARVRWSFGFPERP